MLEYIMEEIKETTVYEIGFLLRNEEGLSFIKRLLAEQGAEISYESPLKQMTLAYPIEKQTGALFGFIHFSAQSENLPKIMRQVELEKESILRTLVITNPITGYRQEREERPLSAEGSSTKSASEVTNEDLEKTLQDILE